MSSHRAPRRPGGGDPFEGERPADREWFAALADDEDPEPWERGVSAASPATLATDVATLSERVTALEDCLVWEVASAQAARRELSELRARLDGLAGPGDVGVDAVPLAARPAPPVPAPASADDGRRSAEDAARRARREVVDGLRASVRAAGRLLEGRRIGPR